MEPLDRQLLTAAAALGTVYLKPPYTSEQFERLTQMGYLRPVRRPTSLIGGPPPPIGFEVTDAGKRALQQ